MQNLVGMDTTPGSLEISQPKDNLNMQRNAMKDHRDIGLPPQ